MRTSSGGGNAQYPPQHQQGHIRSGSSAFGRNDDHSALVSHRSIAVVGRSASSAALTPSPLHSPSFLSPNTPRSTNSRAGNSNPATNAAAGIPAHSQLAHYTLGDCLGRGAFGSVFRGLNWMTGETVAVKQIQLGNIPKSELGEIMSEIDLLKNLNHANIVKYKGSEKTRDHLYIILEYCENGSLHHIVKRFGKFPEGLVGVYITQVLDGLLYLHEQGVIHRDIKGANILTNKDGSVKLADFGVATKTGAMNDYAVVGSPYWMAPEVIDQSGATTASDIWSVGCVVVELLEGKPPYHFLAPMPALFRIVQDDFPPLPEGASPVVKDFLLHCFQKDANLRVSARKLLKHPWMVAARRQLDQMKTGGSLRAIGGNNDNGAGAGGSATVHDEAVKSVREWNEALQEPVAKAGSPRINNGGSSSSSSSSNNNNNAADAAATVRPPAHNKLRRVSNMAPSSAAAANQHGDGATARPGLLKAKAGSRPTLPIDFGLQDGDTAASASAGFGPVGVSRRLVHPLPLPPLDGAAIVSASLGTALKEGPDSPTTKLPLAGAAPAPSLMDQRSKLVDLQRPEDDSDNWDNDFEEGITTTKIAALERSALPDEAAGMARPATSPQKASGSSTPTAGSSDDGQDGGAGVGGGAHSDYDQQTIRPSPQLRSAASLPQVGSSTTPPSSHQPTAADGSTAAAGGGSASTSISTSARRSSVEDYSDLVEDADESLLNARVQDLKLQNSVGKRLFHPDDLKRLSRGGRGGRGDDEEDDDCHDDDGQQRRAPGVHLDTANVAATWRGRSDYSPNATMAMSTVIGPISPSASRANSLRTGKDDKWKEMREALGRYSEDHGDEDYSDVFGKAFAASSEDRLRLPDQQQPGGGGGPLQLTTRLSQRSWLGDDRDDEDDPFAEIDEDLDAEADMEANVARDKHARMCSYVAELVESLRPDAADRELLRACEQIDQVLTDSPEMKAQLLGCHGALALIQLLEIASDTDLVTRLLGILNLIIFDDPEAQENLCLIGAIPVVMNFTTKKWSHELRLEAAHFVFAMCSTSRLTLQFVLSCRGLRTLVDLIDEDYADRKDLVWIGVGCVSSVLELQSPASRTDFCRMLAQDGLLEPLSTALLSVVRDADDPYAQQARAHILQTLLIFSQSDSWLKRSLASRGVLRKLLQTSPMLDPESLTQMLRIIKNLTMNPATLDEIQNANTIEILTRILAERHGGVHGTEVSNQVLNAMYNLCRLSKSRQEEAAESGIIPQLLRVAQTKSPLKQFALPILCDLAHTGKGTRKLLWQHRALQFYVALLEDPYWQVSALESIHVWLQDETHRVEEVLLRPTSVDSLLCLFATAKANSFENLLEPYLKICRLSNALTIVMGRNSAFLRRLVDRLKHPKAVVRLNLLRITKMVCEAHPDRSALIQQFSLHEIIDRLSKHDGAVLVRELARDILSQRYMHPGVRTVRRTMSDVGTASSSAGSPNATAAAPSPLAVRHSVVASPLHAAEATPAGLRTARPSPREEQLPQLQQRRSPSVQQGAFPLDHGSPKPRRRLPLPDILDADAWKLGSASTPATSASSKQEKERHAPLVVPRRAAMRDRSVSPSVNVAGTASGDGGAAAGHRSGPPRSLVQTFSPPIPQPRFPSSASTASSSSTSLSFNFRLQTDGAQGRVLSPPPLASSAAADVVSRKDQNKTMRPPTRPPSRRPIPSLPTAADSAASNTATVRSRNSSSSSSSSSSSNAGGSMYR